MNIIISANSFSFILDYKIPIILKLLEKNKDLIITILVPEKHSKDYQKNNLKCLEIYKDRIEYNTSIKRGISPFIILRNAFKIVKLINKNKKSHYDISIVSHTVSINIATTISSLFIFKYLKNIVLVVSGFGPIKIRNSISIQIKGYIYTKILRFVSRIKKFKIIALNIDDSRVINDFQNKSNVKIIRESIIKKNHTIDENRFIKSPDKNEPWKICFVGRYLLEKGIDHLEYIAEGLNLLEIKYQLVAYGDFDPFNSSTINKYNLHPNIKLEKPIAFEKIFINNHLLLFPTYREGHPKLILEAMSFGCVPLVYPVPGIDVDIIDGFNGLVANSISPKALVSIILKLDRDRSLFKDLRKGCKKYIDKISSGNYLEEFEKIILNK